MGSQSIYLNPKLERMLYDYSAKERIPASQAITKILEAALAPEKAPDNFDQPTKAKRHRIYTQDGHSFATHREAREYLDAKASHGVMVSDEEAPAEEAPKEDSL